MRFKVPEEGKGLGGGGGAKTKKHDCTEGQQHQNAKDARELTE